MGKMFSGLTTEGLEETTDRVGGGFEPLPSGIYDATIKIAFAGESKKGAQSITLHCDINGAEFRNTVYITNAAGENFYVDKDDKTKKHQLPSFTLIDDICLLASGEGLADQETEEKVVKIYNFDEKREIPTGVPTLVALTGGKVKLAIQREIVDVEKKDGSGKYQPTGKTRAQNNIEKAMEIESGRTVNEYRNEIEEPEFMTTWDKRNTGKDRNKAKNASGDAGGGEGEGGSGRPGLTPKKKLFGK